MLINGAWYVNQLPTEIVLELSDGTLKRIALTPFRHIADTDLKSYKGYHPRKMKGQPVPTYLYPFYGLEKSSESLSEVVLARVTPHEKAAFKMYVDSLGPSVNESDVLRKFIRSKI